MYIPLCSREKGFKKECFEMVAYICCLIGHWAHNCWICRLKVKVRCKGDCTCKHESIIILNEKRHPLFIQTFFDTFIYPALEFSHMRYFVGIVVKQHIFTIGFLVERQKHNLFIAYLLKLAHFIQKALKFLNSWSIHIWMRS